MVLLQKVQFVNKHVAESFKYKTYPTKRFEREEKGVFDKKASSIDHKRVCGLWVRVWIALASWMVPLTFCIAFVSWTLLLTQYASLSLTASQSFLLPLYSFVFYRFTAKPVCYPFVRAGLPAEIHYFQKDVCGELTN